MTERHNSLLFDIKTYCCAVTLFDIKTKNIYSNKHVFITYSQNYVFMSKNTAQLYVFMSKELCLYVEKKG